MNRLYWFCALWLALGLRGAPAYEPLLKPTLVPSTDSPHLLVRPPQGLDAHGRVVDPRYDRKDPREGAIPDANTRPVWRTPYAYGYFGARPKEHWYQHFGYWLQYNQWTKR